ncbi:MAG: protein-export membrane protein SecF [Candidatus Wildermuthbacteria bacterium RIFCSPHIGHO2_12_FULL_40_12]|uniref:Protein-export membrane protein SecF n=1 Tax=Candidatus Wildermuthbacteria bacterium RIFCSPHIGHO2_12_FULL_40_12 TaxID=1802457 RepID=A0A1G2RC14_9BACT|nr:MAG: protein-export membrane protein SecF [Candidatus Wildermuthbacteria bacterium RIFCSPHIGHO2_12_FULL_40_12]
MINFVKHSKIYYIFSAVLLAVSLFSLLFFGLKWGIDFTGGSIIEVEFSESVLDNATAKQQLADLNLGEVIVQPTGEKGIILRLKSVDEETHRKVLEKLGSAQERRFEAIGPIIGQELTKKTRVAVILALLSIIIYITFAFAKLSWPMKSWQYSIAALLALFHDILIPLGAFAVLGRFYGAEMTIPIIAALLTVLGYSINDTVVVYDRIRENLLRRKFSTFEETVNQSLNQTLSRSINTVATVLLTLFAIYFFGGETLRYFSLALIVGIVSGMYSSICIASPLMVSWAKWQEKKKISLFR